MSFESIRVMIVDDEPIARQILESYVAMLPQLTLIASCTNAVEALQVIDSQTIDLMLLDINMPQLSGISLLKSLRTPPKVIFTTAYSEHAIESYELDAIDYLLKPIKFDRFLKAINKLKPATSTSTVLSEVPQQNIGSDLIFVKSEGKLIKIDLDEVQFIEGLKDYISFYTTGSKVTIHSTMKAMEEKLAINPTFLRIHKSYIVNLKFVNELDGNCMRINKHLLSIGATYRDVVNATLEKYKRL